MNGDLNINESLITCFNRIFQNTNITNKAPLIMKFFIITRNFGLKNYQNNINKIVNNYNFQDLCLETIKNGFQAHGIEYNKENLISFLITNYHDNGFYFHSFPGIYEDSIRENGILASSRSEYDDKYFKIVDKYHFGEYFRKTDNRICVSEKLSNSATNEYAIFTPEWLEMFLKQGNNDIHEILKNGDINEIQKLADNSLRYFDFGMQRNPLYNPNDLVFLNKYIKNVIAKRFSKKNNKVGIALIEKKEADDYFGKHVKKENIPDFTEYIKSRNMDEKQIFDFIIEVLSNGEKITVNDIPNNMFKIITYDLEQTKEKINDKAK